MNCLRFRGLAAATLVLTLCGQLAAQEAIVSIQGQKASATGLLVKVRGGADAAILTATKERLGLAGMRATAEFRTPGLMLVGKAAQPGDSPAMSQAELELKAKQLMATGLYDYVEPDWIVTVDQVPTDSAYTNGSLWGLRNTGQGGGTAGVDVNAQPAWALTTGSNAVVVGVVDTGIRHTHQDLVGNRWVNPGEIPGNGIDDDANGYIDDVHGINAITNTGNPMDDNDHGTHCAGTIGATANDAGQIVGVAWNVRLMGLKFLSASGSGSTSDAIKCIDYGVAKGAHILSNSWGGGGYSQALRDSIAAASAAGVLFVAAAGNSAANNDVTPHYPSSYDVANMVAVAAVDRTGALASFSCYGAASVALGAPGVAVLSSTAASDSSYASFNGTSMATPHVAGVAALIKSRFPAATMQEIRNRLLASTRPLASLAGRTVTGGMVDAHAALTVAADGVLELRAAAAASPLRSGASTAFHITVTDLTPVTGATVMAALDAGAPTAFLDNGVAPDLRAGDGVYSALLTVPATGSTTTLNVTASAGGPAATGAFPFSIINPPGNDDFANRVLLAAGTTQATGTNQLSTFEAGEPRFPSVAGSKSVWWEWAAGTSGSITVTTSGSSYDTTLAVYSGNGTLGSLTHLGSNDDDVGLASRVVFTAVAGQRYYFQVNGYSSSEGRITLNYPAPAAVNSPPAIVTQPVGALLVAGDALALSVTASGTAPLAYQWFRDAQSIPGATAATYSVASVTEAHAGGYHVVVSNAFGTRPSALAYVGVDPISVRPSNDAFVNAGALPGTAGRVAGTNLRASAEAGEPDHAGASAPVESVWYRWTAPVDGTLSLDTYGSSLDTTLAVYTGAAVGALTQRAANNDSGGLQSFVTLPVTAGQVLSIAVDGVGTLEGIFSLNYFFQPAVAGLANDAFASRTVVSGAGGTFTGGNITATGEDDEPVHEVSAPPTHSVWWSWTAPAAGVAVIDTLGSDFDTVLAVYSGGSLAALTPVAANDDAGGPESRVAFPCAAGTAYAIAVDGRGAAQGRITLHITSGASEPEVAVEQPVGTVLVDGLSMVSWSQVATGEHATRTFTVRNVGGAELMGLAARIEGAAEFTLTTPPAAAVKGGESTTFSVRFTPTGLGARSAVLRLSSNDADEHPFDIALAATGVLPAPEIVLEEPAGRGLVDGGATTDFGLVGMGRRATRTYTVRNVGNATLDGLAVSFTGQDAADFTLAAAPAAAVAPGGSTSFTLEFSPSGLGARTAALRLASNDEDENPFDVALAATGMAVPPTVRTINATDRGWYQSNGTHDPGNRNYLTGFSNSPLSEHCSFFIFEIPPLAPNETLVSAELRLSNPSSGYASTDPSERFELHHVSTPAAALTAGTAGTAGFADLLDGELFGARNVTAADNGTTVVVPLGSAALGEIALKAGAQAVFGGSLTTLETGREQFVFGYTGGGSLMDTQLVFTTISTYTDAEIAVEQPAGTSLVDGGSTVGFGGTAPGGVLERAFTVRNVGVNDLTGIRATLEGADAADFSLVTEPAGQLAPAASTVFTVRFTPAAGGPKNAVLRIASNDADESPFDIALTGTGLVPTPEIVVEQPLGTGLVDGVSVVDFGYRVAGGGTASLVFTLRNTGTADLTGLGITLEGADAADFSVTSAPVAPVAPGGGTSFTVRFTPSATGLRTAALRLASNDWDEDPFDITLNGRGYTSPAGIDFKIVSLGSTGAAVVDHNSLTGDDRGGIAVTTDRVFVTGDSATSRHTLDLLSGASIGRVSDGLCGDIGSGRAYVLAHNGVEVSGGARTVSQLIQLDPVTGALTSTVIPLSLSFTTSYNNGVFSGNGRVVVHNGSRVYDILVPSGVVNDLGPMSAPPWYSSESWAVWGVAEHFDGSLHLAYRASGGNSFVRRRVPDGLQATISSFTNLSDLASWTVSPATGRWYFHHEYSGQFGGSAETLGYADAVFEMGPPTQPPAITSALTASTMTGAPFSYQIRASRSPTGYAATGLPPGLSVDGTTGLISGSVLVAGVYPVTISATNIIGTTDAVLTVTAIASVAEIGVEQPAGMGLVDGVSTVAFGSVPLTSSVSRVFTIRNTGTVALAGIAASFTGPHAADWRVTSAPPATIFPSSSATFTVSFQPGAAGARTATLQIASNDADENPFDIALSGSGTVAAGTAALFANASYVDTGTFGEMESTRSALAGAGYTVTTFTGVTAAAWNAAFAGAAVVVVPELERGSLVLDAAAAATVNSHLSAGRSLIVMGDVGANDSLFLNMLRGWQLASGGVLNPLPLAKVAGVRGFENSPSFLVARSATYGLASASLPLGARPVYRHGADTAVFLAGGVGYMGYDWFEGPDPAWTLVLADLITALGTVEDGPDIAVHDPAGGGLADGGTTALGNVLLGSTVTRVFTLWNVGTTPLTGISAAIDGTHVQDFHLAVPPPATLAAGASTTLTLRFSPGAAEPRTATLRIASNDVDENPFDITLTGRGHHRPEGLDFKILALGTTGAAVTDHDSLTGDDCGGIAVTMDRVFVTGDNATSRHTLDLAGGAPIGRVSKGLCGDIGMGAAYVLAYNGVEIGGTMSMVNQLIELDPRTGALSRTIIPLSASFMTGFDCGVFSGNGRVVVHNGSRVYDILVPSGRVADLGPMPRPNWRISESWAVWGVAEFFQGRLHLAYRTAAAHAIHRSRVPDGQVQTIATFNNLGDMASWTVSPVTGRWYFHHENTSQFGGTRETLGHADASFEMRYAAPRPEIDVLGPANAALADGPGTLNFGSGIPAGETRQQLLTVRNLGAAALNLIGAPVIDGPHAADFQVTGPDTDQLPPGASTTMTVRFTPRAHGPRSAALHLVNTDGDESPYDIRLTGTATGPEISVEQPARTVLVHGASTVAFGPTLPLTPVSRTFTVKNLGTAPLTGIALTSTGADANFFTLISPPPASIPPQGSATFEIQFTAHGPRAHSATLALGSNDADENPFEIQLAAQAVAVVEPRIETHPQSQVAALGQPVTFSAVVDSPSPPRWQWQRGNGTAFTNIPGARSTALTLPAVKLADAARLYRLNVTSSHGAADSQPAALTVVDTAGRRFNLPAGGRATFTASAATTAGATLEYVWLKNGGPLPADSRYSVGPPERLVIHPLQAGDAGTYTCRVTGPGGALPSGGNVLTVFSGAPVIPPGTIVMHPAIVGGEYRFQIPLDPAHGTATSFTAAPLPPGLRLDAVTGEIFGKPTRARLEPPHTLQLTASNTVGTARATAALAIHPLPASTEGDYLGIIERGPESEGLGGRLELKITASGSYTGRITLGRRAHSLPPGSITTTRGSSLVTGGLRLNRAPLPPLEVSFSINTATGSLSGMAGSAGIQAWKKAFMPADRAPLHEGYHTFILFPAAGNVGVSTIPQGAGFGSFRVPSRLDTFTITGKTADGDAFTSSSFLGPDGQVVVYDDLPSMGSLLGHFLLSPRTSLVHADSMCAGTLTWSRPAARVAAAGLYRAGFAPVTVTVAGGLYLPPAAGAIVLGKLTPAQADNATLSFTGAGIGGPPSRADRLLSLVPGAQLSLPATSTTPTSIRISTATGHFSGSFSLVDPHPASPYAAPVRRTATFQGVISGPDPSLQGHGYFLLPELPQPVYPQPLVPPMHSGSVLLE